MVSLYLSIVTALPPRAVTADKAHRAHAIVAPAGNLALGYQLHHHMPRFGTGGGQLINRVRAPICAGYGTAATATLATGSLLIAAR
jgi:hypothetical protein